MNEDIVGAWLLFGGDNAFRSKGHVTVLRQERL